MFVEIGVALCNLEVPQQVLLSAAITRPAAIGFTHFANT
jgi:hypothetical protein